MKKLILIVLAAALTLTLCACGAKKDALTTAQEMIGEDISSLTAAIGEPDNSSYACLLYTLTLPTTPYV